MLSKEEIIKIAKAQAKLAKKMTPEELKKEFISYFGIDAWNEEETMSKLIDISFKVTEDLGIEMVPVIFEDFTEVNRVAPDSRIYFGKDPYIAINRKYATDLTESLKCLFHEYRHLHQMYRIVLMDDIVSKRLKEELTTYTITELESEFTEVELDAYAYTKYAFLHYFNISISHKSKEYDKLVTLYYEKYLIPEFNN